MSETNASADASEKRPGRASLPNALAIPIAGFLLLLFIALLFPWDSVARRIAWEIAAASGSRVTIGDLAPALTARGPVLRARHVDVEHPAVEHAHLDELEIAPRLSASWFDGEPTLRVWADGELGLIDGVLALGAAPTFSGQVARIDLARVPLRLDASGLRLSGELSANADVTLSANGTLAGHIDFDTTSLVVEANALPIAIPFTRAYGVIEILETGATRIESTHLEGQVLEGEVSGEIGLVHHSQSPPIDLKARIRIIDPTLRRLAPGMGLRLSREGEANVKIAGTIDGPEIVSVDSAALRIRNSRQASGPSPPSVAAEKR
ncbi:MAG: type II secretion system protein GspN [Deltaproteobacteria bacterium]|nr:type II secretion system protein GspN [Deltaproteobacteria bacterium]